MISRWGIRTKLVAAISLLVVGAAVALVLTTPRRVERQALRAVNARGRSIAQMTAYAVRNLLSDGDTPGVNQMVQGTRRDPDLAYVVVSDATGKIVAHVRGVNVASDPRLLDAASLVAHPSSDDWVGFSSDVMLDSEKKGTVYLGVSLADLRQEVAAASRASVISGVILVLAGGAFAFGIGTLLTRPIGQLASTAGYIASGDLDQRAEKTSDDEVGQLVIAFNMMVDSLQRARDELAQSKENLEKRVHERTADVEEALRQLEIAKNQAEAANRMKSDFLATMSHEVRTPMNGVLGTLSLVLSSELDEEQRRLLGLAKASADALLVIINDILDLSKIEAGRMELAPAPFRLQLTCDEISSVLSVRAREKRLTLTVTVDPGIPEWLMGDAGRLRQVLINLTGNAIKFTERGSVTLFVGAAQTDTHATLKVEVRDTGIGIDEATQQRLFQKFVQADASMARRYGGTGLGLAISKNLVEMMGGSLSLKSAPGRGSVFSFEVTLPIASAPEETGESVGFARGPGKSTPGRPVGPRRLLVVDDNPVNLTVASAMLKKQGHVVDLARDGGQAVDKALARSYDAIFMDLQMPVMDGIAATQAIRSKPGPNAETPIIALTANAMESDRLRSLSGGMNDHLTKPISPEALRAAIERWCGAEIEAE